MPVISSTCDLRVVFDFKLAAARFVYVELDIIIIILRLISSVPWPSFSHTTTTDTLYHVSNFRVIG